MGASRIWPAIVKLSRKFCLSEKRTSLHSRGMKRVAFLFLASCAFANDTAIQDGGDGPAPLGGHAGTESVIRMVREHLAITFGTKKTTVHATFVFLNTKRDAAARQTVGFPDRTAMAKLPDSESDLSGPIENLVTLVDGKEQKSRQLRGWVREIDGADEQPER